MPDKSDYLVVSKVIQCARNRTLPGASEALAEGRPAHLAQFDEKTVIVYQAYCEAIGRYAIEHGQFGGDFSFGRMSWIKPNFLWMMYRSGWGTKENQEVTLALRVSRQFFDSILAAAIP